MAPDDGAFMRRALVLAERGWGQTAPNPLVGAVVVLDGVVVGEGWHAGYGQAHAEIDALRAAGEHARGATLYVTLEPCNHHGQTPPCSHAIRAAGIARVVVASRDVSEVARGGAEHLQAAGIGVRFDVEVAAALEMNAPFFHSQQSARPFVQLKLALSLDGALTDTTKSAGWLTGEASRAEVHRMRAGSDAIGIGIGTALADDPLLTVRAPEPPPRVAPARVVFDTSARLPLASRLVKTARDVRTFVICWAPDPQHAAALEHAGVNVLHAATLGDALTALRHEGVRSVLLEGGATLAGAFLQEGLVDRLVIFRAPLILGAGALSGFGDVEAATARSAARWRIVRSERFGDDELTVYAPPTAGAGAS